MPQAKFSNAFQQALEETGVRLVKVADDAEVSRRNLYNILNGHDTSLSTAVNIAHALDRVPTTFYRISNHQYVGYSVSEVLRDQWASQLGAEGKYPLTGSANPRLSKIEEVSTLLGLDIKYLQRRELVESQARSVQPLEAVLCINETSSK